MTYPAFEAREVTGEVLLKDRTLMELWKWASDEGQVQAVEVGGRHYTVVKDADLAAKVQAFAPGLKCYAYDETTRELR